ncbi:hypothetical protein WT60_17015 [Burkholderia sp. MSMB617WGS]|nr:hypothetical protein WT60_17015 [Burkholderia sp. MSMB617WGS]
MTRAGGAARNARPIGLIRAGRRERGADRAPRAARPLEPATREARPTRGSVGAHAPAPARRNVRRVDPVRPAQRFAPHAAGVTRAARSPTRCP